MSICLKIYELTFLGVNIAISENLLMPGILIVATKDKEEYVASILPDKMSDDNELLRLLNLIEDHFNERNTQMPTETKA